MIEGKPPGPPEGGHRYRFGEDNDDEKHGPKDGKRKARHDRHLAEVNDDRKHRPKHSKTKGKHEEDESRTKEQRLKEHKHASTEGPDNHHPDHHEPGRKLGHGAFPGATLQRNETFLRGGYPTGPDGLAELVTIYPGFYARRTAHVHAMIHMNWDKSENGYVNRYHLLLPNADFRTQ